MSAPPTAPDVLVRVLGRPGVPSRPELVGRPLQVVVCLAVHRCGVSVDRLRDVVWPDRLVPATVVFNVVSQARSLLGLAPDGELLLFRRHPQRGFELHPSVGTDVGYLAGCLAWARGVASHEAVSVLREALSLVKGPLLDDVAYDWLSAETSLRWVSAGLVHEAATLLLHLASDPASLLTARTALESLDSQEVDSRC